jgi:hypothetical protein
MLEGTAHYSRIIKQYKRMVKVSGKYLIVYTPDRRRLVYTVYRANRENWYSDITGPASSKKEIIYFTLLKLNLLPL